MVKWSLTKPYQKDINKNLMHSKNTWFLQCLAFKDKESKRMFKWLLNKSNLIRTVSCTENKTLEKKPSPTTFQSNYL